MHPSIIFSTATIKTKHMDKPDNVILRRVFGLLALAVSMTEGNTLTLADLIFWANRDSIAFKVSLRSLIRDVGVHSTTNHLS